VIFQSRLTAMDRTKSLLPVVWNQHEIISRAYIRHIQSYQKVLGVQHNSVFPLFTSEIMNARMTLHQRRAMFSLSQMPRFHLLQTVSSYIPFYVWAGCLFARFAVFRFAGFLISNPFFKGLEASISLSALRLFSWGEVMLPAFRRLWSSLQ